MYQRILITTDGQALSKKAVTAGITLAAALQAEIVAFTVVPKLPHWNDEKGRAMSHAETEDFENQRSLEAQALVDAVLHEAQQHNVKASAVTGRGAVAESIIHAATEHHCDLIVMASHGRKGIQRVLLGSETMDVLTHSRIAVLVLR